MVIVLDMRLELVGEGENMTELTLAQLERITDFTTTYLSYYDYDSIFADDKVGMLVKRGTIDEYTDEEKLKKDFMQRLARYDIEVKGNLL